MSLLLGLALTLGGLALAGLGVFWVGFQTVGASYPAPEDPPPELPEEPLPDGLPPAVATYLETSLGQPAKRMRAVQAWGRGRLRMFGVMLAPMRFRARCEPGTSFEVTMEVMWFGRTILRVKERWAQGRGERRTTGWKQSEEAGPEVTLEALRHLWTAAAWAPGALADPELWEETDDGPPRLRPAALAAFFHRRSGRLRRFVAAEGPAWKADFGDWKPFHGVEIPSLVQLHPGGSGLPSAVYVVEGVLFEAPDPA